MRMLVTPAMVLLIAVPFRAAGQPAPLSPYREQQFSEIRGLSGQEIEDLPAGRGMGLARAAELNGYPGPRHLLDAVEAGQLHLSDAQLRAVRELFERMSRPGGSATGFFMRSGSSTSQRIPRAWGVPNR